MVRTWMEGVDRRRLVIVVAVTAGLAPLPRVVEASPWRVAALDRSAEPEPAPAAEPAPVPAVVPTPPPPSADEIMLREDLRRDERMAIAGYVVTGLGGLVCLLSLPLYISGRIEEKKEANLFQEAGDPEAARIKKRMGLIGIASGLVIASVGGTLLGVGLTRRNRHQQELQAISTKRTAVLGPWSSGRALGLGVHGRF
ncbi:hypothetical protein [Paraliomyxa miuraensis]|uniref:hypothetical protein n=1 Tax=Paraliomyxa miuraensis TaxID=376150 RepID=UPI0022513D92|nr:hypothetical protein [Paraliomyxa miuraensis]MCX4247374.1 hypothetical protein [Paraliomyxa miuraensis]